MSQFASSHLSPQPIDARPSDLPYGLTWTDFEPVLGSDTSGWSASTSYEKQGLDQGDSSCILTLRHAADATSRTVFVKHVVDDRARESNKYRLLASVGVPTPTVLATISRGGAETIVLEFLPRIGIHFGSPLEVRSLLELAARLNAANVGDAEIESKRPAVPNDDFDRTVLAALREIESSMLRIPAEVLFDAYQRAQVIVAALPLGLNHGEFYFQQVGWANRDHGDELVVFDLATLALRPRFGDVAGILPLLVEQTGRSEAELLAVYLDAFTQFAEPIRLPEDAAREVQLTRVTNACWSLPWLVGASNDASGFDLRGELALKVRWLCDDVKKLGFVATE